MSLGQAIVCDNGTGVVKAGFGGDQVPRTVFPSMIGYPKKSKYVLKGMNMRDVYVGRDADRKRGILRIEYPLEHGIVKNWDDMTALWDHTFNDRLRVDPSKHPVLLTEAPLNPKANREKMCEIMFENYDVRGVYIAIQAVLALYSAGNTTGMTMDIGDGVCHDVPIYEGFALPHAIERLDLAGRDLTNFLVRQMMQQGHAFRTNAEKETVKKIKEQCCYIAFDYEKEKEKAAKGECDMPFELPDGKVIKIGKARFETPESLFQPHLCGLESGGIHEKIKSSVDKCDIDIRRDMYGSIILSGGSTMYDGFEDRLTKELVLLNHSGVKVKVIARPERKYCVWMGGSILGSLDTFRNMWLSPDDWDELGPKGVHSKFF
jgi:actin beta/gamma 1